MISEYPVDDRKIVWIYDDIGSDHCNNIASDSPTHLLHAGGAGKSALTKYLAVHFQAYVTGEVHGAAPQLHAVS